MVRITCKESPSGLFLVVEDNGKGVPAEKIPGIFATDVTKTSGSVCPLSMISLSHLKWTSVKQEIHILVQGSKLLHHPVPTGLVEPIAAYTVIETFPGFQEWLINMNRVKINV